MRRRRQALLDQRRGSAAVRGYGSRWRAYSIARLKRFPFCAMCERLGRLVRAVVTDHIRPHQGDQRLFWDPGNHQSLCKRCHDRKTVLEDGGFGRPRLGG